jgi:hypothetical protein
MEAVDDVRRPSAVSRAGNDCAFLADQLANHETGWSLGTFGAIAEFTRDPDEPVALLRSDTCLAAVTARGGIRIEAQENPQQGLRLFASEGTTRDGWSQRISLCLPDNQCAMSGRTVLTALGPDAQALREQDRDAALFDLGLGTLQVDLCVRVSDPTVAAELASHSGRPLFEPGNPAMGVILVASPHRVFMSRLGRIEVFSPIPPADGTSPQGPHTHVLPKLLGHRRTHAATEPVPDGWIPCAHLYPGHPAKDAFGRSRPFDPARHEAFQAMLRDFGDPELYALKQRALAAVAAGEDPSVIAIADSRLARTNVRVALRQLRATAGASPSLATWLTAHETFDRSELEEHAGRHE